jgi:eukaryotic-like serine/threonine-protein kinase
MQLWTDYEGVTLDGVFPLQKLLMPEGRSAFFSTAGANGEPTVVRLIECHFDEQEILTRWRSVEALNHPNFLKFERFGQTELDGRPVVYAVFEKVDANLAEVLDQGNLPVDDVAQLASSLAAALDVLHTHGFVHEHIQPANIFAVSGTVKLRSDCIREAPEAKEGRAAKQRDVHDLATVLLRALTQRSSIEGIQDSALPSPFAQIIRNGLDGTWDLKNIQAALVRQFGSKPAAPKSVAAAPATTATASQKAPSAAVKPSLRPEQQIPLPLPSQDRYARAAAPRTATPNDVWDRKDTQDRKATRDRKDIWDGQDSGPDTQSFPLRSRWIGVGIGALLLLLCTWALTHAWSAHRHKTAPAATVSQPAASQPTQQSATQSPQPIATTPAPQPVAADTPSASLPTPAGARADWRVIAYTYNRRPDADKKVSDLARSHPELQPVVFTPTGHAPYLVSIGGVMDRDAAHTLAHRSRSLGLPHDMYAQNYSR